MKAHDPAAYESVLAELAALKAVVRRLEIYALRLMKDAGISDEAIGTVLGTSSQAVGQKRHRKP